MSDVYSLDHEEYWKNGEKCKDGYVLSCNRKDGDVSMGDKIYIKTDDLKKVARLLKAAANED